MFEERFLISVSFLWSSSIICKDKLNLSWARHRKHPQRQTTRNKGRKNWTTKANVDNPPRIDLVPWSLRETHYSVLTRAVLTIHAVPSMVWSMTTQDQNHWSAKLLAYHHHHQHHRRRRRLLCHSCRHYDLICWTRCRIDLKSLNTVCPCHRDFELFEKCRPLYRHCGSHWIMGWFVHPLLGR